MPRAAEFEEKEYELVCAQELRLGPSGAVVWSSGQVLEHVLGYDAVTDPGDGHAIWQLLDLPRPPGLVLVHDLWPHGQRPDPDRLPHQPISLMLQYKRPEWVRGARGAQWGLWHTPYFRFAVRRHQQQVLARLESQLAEQAVIRYACPALWQRGHFEAAVLAGRMLQASGFVSPQQLRGHAVWTFVDAGRDGRANPAGRRTPFESFDATLRRALGEGAPAASTSVVPADPLAGHLKLLGEAARLREPRLRAALEQWRGRIEKALDLPMGVVDQVVDLTAIVSLLERTGARWYLTGR